jgi:acetylornithine deacetylase/succinyl-diaminopimelate desuccinylase-like protein
VESVTLKKTIITVVVVLALLSGILVYRAASLFHDRQVEPVLFMSHMDVVPVEEDASDEWTHPAFDGVIENGMIWVRGTVDDKLGVVSLMEAMELLLAENARPERDIYFAFGHDEQVTVEEYLQAIRFYYHLIRRSMAGRE